MSLFAVLLASFLGSSHCAAMCGGFVAFYSCQSGSHDKVSSERHSALLPRFAHQFAHRFAHHAAYHCGRLLTYSLLGALAGIVGGSLDSLGILLGIQTRYFSGTIQRKAYLRLGKMSLLLLTLI